MNILIYSTRSHDREYLSRAFGDSSHKLHFTEASLERDTAQLAQGYRAVCCFVGDNLDRQVLTNLAALDVSLVLLRATGFNNVDLNAADELELTVMRVANYSPNAVAEFTLGLILSLGRGIHRAHNRVREGNFLLDGLLGFDLKDRTVGVIGTGEIGSTMVRILNGFGCRILGYDVQPAPDCRRLGCTYVELEPLLEQSDIISLHVPLTPDTFHLINAETLKRVKPGAMLINTSRGALVDTSAVIAALKARRIGSLGMDVYEEESHLYFQDLSDRIIDDDTFARLLTFPNVLITGHQAFFTHEAMTMITTTTRGNVEDFIAGRDNDNILHPAYNAAR